MIPVQLLKAYGMCFSCAINSLTKVGPYSGYNSNLFNEAVGAVHSYATWEEQGTSTAPRQLVGLTSS